MPKSNPILSGIVQRLKSKTYWTAIIGALLIVVEQSSGLFSAYLPEDMRTITVLLWPVLMITLREITKTSIDEK